MDHIQFAKMVGFITSKMKGDTLDEYELTELTKLMAQQLQTPEGRPLVSETIVCRLLSAMKVGQKIEAIRAYRELTGAGLKEAKDAIENHWVIFAEMK